MTWVEKAAGTRIKRLSLRRVTRVVREGRETAMTGTMMSQACEERRRVVEVFTQFILKQNTQDTSRIKFLKAGCCGTLFARVVSCFPMFFLCPAGSGSV